MEDKKELYWNHFISNKNFWGYGVTLKRLEKVKLKIWDDYYFWSDILFRHNGAKETPEELLLRDKHLYNHCFGNIASMIHDAMRRHKIIK